MIAAEEGDTVTIQSGPGLSTPQKKGEIKSRKPQEMSPMPAGLLNASTKEQVLDLLAFLKSQEVLADAAAQPKR
jgi:hypothetical protein